MGTHIIYNGYGMAVDRARRKHQRQLRHRFFRYQEFQRRTLTGFQRAWIALIIQRRVRRLELTASGRKPSQWILG
ncbi:hypothetical protein SH661x_003235 [Planctomicrobium sp. SH661]|uniref:hypothetical protein n=1 Tax=Planctomicrobium sp. SH661 TaxID=3448124 RepID=UPI003F5B9913